MVVVVGRGVVVVVLILSPRQVTPAASVNTLPVAAQSCTPQPSKLQMSMDASLP